MAEYDEPALRSLIASIPGAESLRALSSVQVLYGLDALAAGAGDTSGLAATAAGGAGNGTAAEPDAAAGGLTGITKPVVIDVPEEKYSEFVTRLNGLADKHRVDTWHSALVTAELR